MATVYLSLRQHRSPQGAYSPPARKGARPCFSESTRSGVDRAVGVRRSRPVGFGDICAAGPQGTAAENSLHEIPPGPDSAL
jgi:hypothetical protein